MLIAREYYGEQMEEDVTDGARVGMTQTRKAYRLYVKTNWEAREHFEYLCRWNKLKWVTVSRVSVGFNWLRNRIR